MKLGIGIITCQRDHQFGNTLKAVEDNTKTQCFLVVADDGSTDYTAALCRELRLPFITGKNRGVAWNKNRALFALFAVLHCNVVVLLEDDAAPTAPGWERDWIEASLRWGHVNLAGEWFPEGSRISGAGTPLDPYLSTAVSGQVEGFSAAAIRYGGYLDPRFRGYGFGHIEHTRRMIRCGFGGRMGLVGNTGVPQPLYALIAAPFAVAMQKPGRHPEDTMRNEVLCRQLLDDQSYRMPWRDDAELAEFRGEMQAANLGVAA